MAFNSLGVKRSLKPREVGRGSGREVQERGAICTLMDDSHC